MRKYKTPPHKLSHKLNKDLSKSLPHNSSGAIQGPDLINQKTKIKINSWLLDR